MVQHGFIEKQLGRNVLVLPRGND